MEITVNVNINALELSAAIQNLATAISASSITSVASFAAPLTPVHEQAEPSKSEFSFKLTDPQPEPTAPVQEPDAPATVETQKPVQETGTADTDPELVALPPLAAITLEQVRAKLAALSQAGKQAQVKELITKTGARKLTEIPTEKYAELLAAAEAL